MTQGGTRPGALDERLEHAVRARPPRCSRLRRGYAPEEVDAFLDRARRACTSTVPQIRAAQVRTVGFRLVLGGYDVTATDAVLAAIEDALAAGEHGRALTSARGRRWLETAEAMRTAIAARLRTPAGERFPRGRWFERGYHPGDVDALCSVLADHLSGRTEVRAPEVRGALFRPRYGWRGYREVPVDVFLDRVVELLTGLEAAARR